MPCKSPEAIARRKAKRDLPEFKARIRAYQLEYWRRPENAARLRQRRNAPENRAKMREYLKEYAPAYKRTEEYRKKNRERNAFRRKTDPQFLLAARLRDRVNMFFRSRGLKRPSDASAVRWLGCTVAELVAHIESYFPLYPGMSWDNKNEWSIDHIKPLSYFDLTVPEQFEEANHWTNLQPLWKADNSAKNNKLLPHVVFGDIL